MSGQAPAGWYPQPDGTQRWWTGEAWGEQTAPSPPAPSAGPAAVTGRAVAPFHPPVPPLLRTFPVPQGRPAPLVPGAYGWSPAARIAPKSPGLALLASFFLPGLGQFVNGQAGKGVAFLLGYLFSFLLMFVLIGFLTAPALWIWSMVDAYTGAQAWNARHGILS